MKFPGTIRILKATQRIRINTQCKSDTVKYNLHEINENMSIFMSYLYGICTGGNITDHKPTAPLLGCVGVTGMDEVHYS